MGVLAAALLFLGYYKGEAQHITGMKITLNMVIGILPMLIFAFIIAGMIQVLIPHELLLRWIGKEAGIKGILIGSAAGALIPGGPYIVLPITAGLIRSGVGIGTMVAFLTGWALLGIGRLPLEIGILGWKFMLMRTACVFFFPPIAGLIAQTFFSGVK